MTTRLWRAAETGRASGWGEFGRLLGGVVLIAAGLFAVLYLALSFIQARL